MACVNDETDYAHVSDVGDGWQCGCYSYLILDGAVYYLYLRCPERGHEADIIKLWTKQISVGMQLHL
jgi:hypothetical protein